MQELKPGDVVKVYRNLKHGRAKPALYSVMHKGRIVARLSQLWLAECRFVVNDAGRQRVLQSKQKNVHAFVVGVWCARQEMALGPDLPLRVTYNPYVSGFFHVLGQPECGVAKADAVLLNKNGISVAFVTLTKEVV